MNSPTEWAYSFREEYGWTGPFESREEAILEAAAANPEVDWCYVGVMVRPRRDVSEEVLIADIAINVIDECGDLADDYLMGIPKSVLEELREALQAVWDAWETKHGLEPQFWTVRDVETSRWWREDV